MLRDIDLPLLIYSGNTNGFVSGFVLESLTQTELDLASELPPQAAAAMPAVPSVEVSGRVSTAGSPGFAAEGAIAGLQRRHQRARAATEAEA